MVNWTETAKADLGQIYNYINKDSNYYARKVVTELKRLSYMQREILMIFFSFNFIYPRDSNIC